MRWSTHSVENITFFSGTRKHKHIQKLTSAQAARRHTVQITKYLLNLHARHTFPMLTMLVLRTSICKKKSLEKEYMRMEVSVGLLGEACQVFLLSIASKKRKK